MDKQNIQHYLIKEYNRLAYTHNYIFGYVANGMVYGAKVMEASELLPYITSIDCASAKNGGTYQLKYKPNKAQLEVIKAHACEIREICSEKFLENEFKNGKHNRGQLFEEMATTVFEGVQNTQKNAKFTDCGDMVANGIHYQVKYLKATFTDERTIKHLSR